MDSEGAHEVSATPKWAGADREAESLKASSDMRIGIATFLTSPNYGAALQAFALQAYLRGLGHAPECIDCACAWDKAALGLRGWLSPTVDGQCLKVNTQIRKRLFRRFRRGNVAVTQRHYWNVDELRATPPIMSAYICGSDQVWSPRCAAERDEGLFWLRFGPPRIRRIAYAASFGVPRLDDAAAMRYREYIQGIDHVSVREREGVEIVSELGRGDAVWVPDPTVLLRARDYDVVSGAPSRGRSLLFSYLLGQENAKLEEGVRASLESCLGLESHLCHPRSSVGV